MRMANEIPGIDVRAMLSLQISGGNRWLKMRNKSIPPESNPMSFSKWGFFKAPWLNTDISVV
jgi:hypothetical protein